MPPRYAPWLTPLADDPEHLRRAPAPAFWRLIAHHAQQINDCCCGLATAAMLVNGLRGSAGLAAGEPFATQASLLAALDDPRWTAAVGADGGPGLRLTEMAALLADSFRASLSSPPAIAAVPVTAASAAALAGFRAALAALERGRLLLSVNFHAGAVVGAGDYGHHSPLGAYDAARDRVLVLDVDRAWYEPYWVPAPKLLAGMATVDRRAGTPRGYIRIEPAGLTPPPP